MYYSRRAFPRARLVAEVLASADLAVRHPKWTWLSRRDWPVSSDEKFELCFYAEHVAVNILLFTF